MTFGKCTALFHKYLNRIVLFPIPPNGIQDDLRRIKSSQRLIILQPIQSPVQYPWHLIFQFLYQVLILVLLCYWFVEWNDMNSWPCRIRPLVYGWPVVGRQEDFALWRISEKLPVQLPAGLGVSSRPWLDYSHRKPAALFRFRRGYDPWPDQSRQIIPHPLILG